VVKSYAAEHAADLARARAKLAELGRAKTAAKAEEERGMQRRPSVVAKLVEPRAKSDWVPDSAAKECQVCKAKFTFVKRKHHCRICARVLCSMRARRSAHERATAIRCVCATSALTICHRWPRLHIHDKTSNDNETNANLQC
jgi:hypothetical protein